jgi:hypothetical protein
MSFASYDRSVDVTALDAFWVAPRPGWAVAVYR